MAVLTDPAARAAFFTAVRAKPFGGSLSASQVTGMDAILDACPVDLGTDALAYCLATAYHETARTMLPIKEYGGPAYYRRMYDPLGERPETAKTLGNTKAGDGALFAGRGYVQLTGRANYRRATGELQARGYLAPSQDLTVTPDMAMVPDIAAAVMFCGMVEGWFTGKKLGHYFGTTGAGAPGADPINARRIINGTDKAGQIAGYHAAFRSALVAAGHKPGAVAGSVPTKPVEITPLPPAGPVFAPAPRNGGLPSTGEKQPDLPLTNAPSMQTKPSLGARLASWLMRPWFG